MQPPITPYPPVTTATRPASENESESHGAKMTGWSGKREVGVGK